MSRIAMIRNHRVSLLLLVIMLYSMMVVGAEVGELRIDPGEHTAGIADLATDKSGRWLISASHDKTARIWDVSDGSLIGTLRIPLAEGNSGKLYAAALTADGQTIALAGWTDALSTSGNAVYLFDRASRRMLRTFVGLPNAITALDFSADGQVLAVGLAGKNGVRMLSVGGGYSLAEDRDYGGKINSVHFGRDGNLVTTSVDGLLRLYRFDGEHLTMKVKNSPQNGKIPGRARFSPDGKYIATGFTNSSDVHVLNAANLSLNYAADTGAIDGTIVSVNWSQVAWSLDGKHLYAGGSVQQKFDGRLQHAIRHWTNAGKGRYQDWMAGDLLITSLLPLPDSRLMYSNSAAGWGLFNNQGTLDYSHEPAIADFRVGMKDFLLSEDGSKIRFCFAARRKFPAVFDGLNHGFLPDRTNSLIPPLQSSTEFVVVEADSANPPTLNGIVLKLKPGEIAHSRTLLPDGRGLILGTNRALYHIDRDGHELWKKEMPGNAWIVNASRDGRWVVAAYSDGVIRWHRASDGSEQLALYPHPDRKRWVMWTPEGYYDASPGAEDLIGWHVNRNRDQAADFFPASRFRERFYRPDRLARVLQAPDDAHAVPPANEESARESYSIAQSLPPVVEILSPANDSAVQANKVKIRYSVRSSEPVTALRVRVNGQLQAKTRDLVVTAGDASQEIEVTIPERDVEIQLFAENNYSVSMPAIVHLKWAGKSVAIKSVKPRLYVLAAGVSKYKNAEFNLGLAAKDARDFANTLQSQKGGLYDDVSVRLLTDDQASKDAVLDGLEWLKQQVGVNDVGIMFIAGHGMNDKQGNYYFLPYNADPDQLMKTGVSQNDIKLTFASLPGKTLFFIDTCYSGSVLGRANTSGIINELASAENGAVVFAASSAGQVSQENAAWGNGAFTKAVVEGLNGRADYRKDGLISTKGLNYYLDERVRELTGGKQSPVSIMPGGVTDFTIFSTIK